MNGRRIWAVMSESFWILLLALVALFAFLLALGAYSPGEVVTLTIVMVVLFVLWVGHAVWVSRADRRDPRRSGAERRVLRRRSHVGIEARVRGAAAAVEPASLPSRS